MAILAELVDRTLAGVAADSPEICPLPEALNAVVQALNVRIAFARLSKTNSASMFTEEFFPNALEYDITGMIGNGTPVGCEILHEGRYVAVRHFAHERLPQNNLELIGTGCAFEKRTVEATGQTTQYVRFNAIPQAAVRIAYTSGVVANFLETDAGIPDSVTELVVLEAQNILIPRIQLRYQINLNRNDNDRRDAQVIVGTYNNLIASNAARIPDLIKLWKQWAYAPKQPLIGRRATPRAARLYGDD